MKPLGDPRSINPADGDKEPYDPFKKFSAKARGHLTGAVWKEIDQEGGRTASRFWSDSEMLTDDEKAEFTGPSARTDFLPMYNIANPELGWQSNLPEPEFSTRKLSELTDPAELASQLKPLVTAYKEWIAVQKSELNGQKPAGQPEYEHINKCENAGQRISEGIDLLESDEQARIAFCFMNKAIWQQAYWNGENNMIWRPFQLAFILMNIPGLFSKNHPDREICDLLWFPTGGGKTEAYLALVAFTIGLRRLRKKDGPCVISRYTLRLLTIQQFRRTARLLTACEFLRNYKSENSVGWHPANHPLEDYVWGYTNITLGLWVGLYLRP